MKREPDLKVTHEKVPDEAKEIKWTTKGEIVCGLFLGIAKDPIYPNNYLGIVHDWEKGLIYFSLPIHLRRKFINFVSHDEVSIEYLGMGKKIKNFK